MSTHIIFIKPVSTHLTRTVRIMICCLDKPTPFCLHPTARRIIVKESCGSAMADDGTQATAAAEGGAAVLSVVVTVAGDARVAEPSQPLPPPSLQQELQTADEGASSATPAPADDSDIVVLEPAVPSNDQLDDSDVVVLDDATGVRSERDAVTTQANTGDDHSDDDEDVVIVEATATASEAPREVISLISSQPEATPETAVETPVDTTAVDAAAAAADIATAAATAAVVAEQEGTQRGLEDEMQCILCHDGLFKVRKRVTGSND